MSSGTHDFTFEKTFRNTWQNKVKKFLAQRCSFTQFRHFFTVTPLAINVYKSMVIALHNNCFVISLVSNNLITTIIKLKSKFLCYY